MTEALRPPPHLDAEVFTREAANSGTRILDARSDSESFDAGHFPHAIHAPLKSSFFSTSAGSYLAASDSILLVLENGNDADLAARQLYRIGFDKIVGWITTAEAQENGLFTARLERINLPEFNSAKAVVQGEIIDVRTTAEFQSGHLEGARSFPYTRLKAHLDELPKDRRLFVHCGSGKRASLAASFLLTQGFDAVHVDGVCDECERIAEAQGVAH